jgi:hypothetical protein
MAWKSPSSPRSREDEDAPSWSEPFRHAAVRQAVSEIEPEEQGILREERPHALLGSARIHRPRALVRMRC